MGGQMTPIINRNASIPVKQTETFSTGADYQEAVEIHVLQGERPFAKDNKSLGLFTLKGIPSAPKGTPKINVTFQLDVNGLLSVSAREEQSGVEQSIKIEGASVLGREEVAKMLEEAEENATLDKAKKSIVSITYELDNLLHKMQKVTSVTLEKENNSNVKCCLSKIYALLARVYKQNKISSISTVLLSKLRFCINILTLEYVKRGLFNVSENSSDGIIDIDIAE